MLLTMKKLLSLFFLSLCAAAAAAEQPGASYDYGMEQRRRGDHAGARETFLNLLKLDPLSGGGLEGLALASLALGQYEEAAAALESWNAQSPDNPYILSLLLRAQSGAGDERGALATARRLAALEPQNCAARRRVETLSERAGNALFPAAGAYRAVSLEDLASGNPQRVIYSGTSAGASFRTPRGALDVTGGAELRTETQRNAGGGFTYFEIQEQRYAAGLAGRARRLRWEAEAGQSVFTDVSDPGGAPLAMLRARLSLRRGGDGLDLATQPRLVRVSGGGRFYRLMREASARAESGGTALGWDWYGKAGLSAISGGRTLGTAYLRGTKELGWSALTASYDHGRQEFYGAAASGRLLYVRTDKFGAAFSRGEQGVYRAWAGAFQSYYSDSNRLLETGLELTGWLPRRKDLYGTYRYSSLDFRRAYSGYDNLDEAGHWLGAGWRRCDARGWSAAAGYEHGYLTDSLLSYHADVYTAEAELYSSRGSLKLTGRRKTTGARGRSWSAGLQARLAF